VTGNYLVLHKSPATPPTTAHQ